MGFPDLYMEMFTSLHLNNQTISQYDPFGRQILNFSMIEVIKTVYSHIYRHYTPFKTRHITKKKVPINAKTELKHFDQLHYP